MYRITGTGSGSVTTIQSSNKHTIFMKASWVVVDVTDPDNPIKIDVTTLSPSCTLRIERQFDSSFDIWEEFDVNPIAINVLGGLTESRVDGGAFRYTVTDLPVNYELWINATFR